MKPTPCIVQRRVPTLHIGLLATCALFALLACMLVPAAALAKSYTCDSVDIDTTVGQDGSLGISETRNFDFDGDFSLVGVILDPPYGGSYKVAHVYVKDSMGGRTELAPVKFESKWRSAGGPGAGYYSIDEPRETIYCFSEYSGACSVTVDYKYTNAVQVHEDVAELYWQFVGREWEVDPGYVELAVHLPVPSGEQVVSGDNVRAWGHGSLSGSVEFAEDGTVLYTVPDARSGEFCEARLTFPTSWVPKVSDKVRDASPALEGILAEEEDWAQKANNERMRARVISGIPGGTSILLIIASIIVFFRRGKEYKPVFQDDYWRDVPAPGVDPAVIGRIYRFNGERSDDITATLMHLHAIGAVELEKFTYEKAGKLGGSKTVEDYRIRAHLENARRPLSDIDRATTKLFFDQIGKHSDTVTLGEVKRQAKKNPETFVKRVEAWQEKVGAEVENGKFFEESGDNAAMLFSVLAIVYAIVGIGILYALDFPGGFLPIGLILIGSLATLIISMQMRRRSHEANEINARCGALRHWFKDFTNLKEAIPTDVKVWGELLVYAYILGVSDDVIKQLRVHVPQLWEDTYWTGYSVWYWSSDGHSPAACDVVGPTLSESISTAKSAVSSSSSGSGGGGGFSGGGGGGFGGGGGGFAR